LRADDDRTRLGLGGGERGLDHRRADHDRLPAVVDPAEADEEDVPRADADFQVQPVPLGGGERRQGFLNAQAALGGQPRGPREVVYARRRPEGEQGVAGELDHVTAVGLDRLDELAEVGVENLGEFLDPVRPARAELLAQRREARDVGEEDGDIGGLRERG
jgi:hypothetical protein